MTISTPDAEHTCLGAVLLQPALIAELAGQLAPQHFAGQQNRRCYEAMLALFERSEEINPTTVRAEASDVSAKYLGELLDGRPSLGSIGGHARIVRSAARRRQALALGERLVHMARSNEHETDELLDEHQAALSRLLETGEGRAVQSIRQVIPQAVEQLESYVRSDSGVIGIPTGLIDLDRLTGGMMDGGLYLIGAYTGRGKSAMCTQIAIHAAQRGHRVLMFSMEMPPPRIVQRMLLGEAGVCRYALRTNDAEWAKVSEAVATLQPLPIDFDRRESPTLPQVRASSRQCSPALVIVDYLQRMSTRGDKDNWIAVGECAKGLKSLAMALGVPVLAAVQLNAEAADHPPQMSHFAEARGVISREADVVVMPHPVSLAEWEDAEIGLPRVSLYVRKHRDGPLATIKLGYERRWTRFVAMGGEA